MNSEIGEIQNVSGERVVKWQGITIAWPRPPQTFKGAKNRIVELQNAIRWMLSDLDGGKFERERLVRERFHLETLLTARWDANNGRLIDIPCNCGDPNCLARLTDGQDG